MGKFGYSGAILKVDLSRRRMVNLQQIKKVPRTSWAITSVQDTMTPASKLKVAYADRDVLSMLQEMNRENADHIPVIEAGKSLE